MSMGWGTRVAARFCFLSHVVLLLLLVLLCFACIYLKQKNKKETLFFNRKKELQSAEYFLTGPQKTWKYKGYTDFISEKSYSQNLK